VEDEETAGLQRAGIESGANLKLVVVWAKTVFMVCISYWADLVWRDEKVMG